MIWKDHFSASMNVKWMFTTTNTVGLVIFLKQLCLLCMQMCNVTMAQNIKSFIKAVGCDYFSPKVFGTHHQCLIPFFLSLLPGLPDPVSVQPARRGQRLVQRQRLGAGSERVHWRLKCLTLCRSGGDPDPRSFAGEPVCQPGCCLPQHGEIHQLVLCVDETPVKM